MPKDAFVAPPGQGLAQHRMDEAHLYNEWLLERGRRFIGRRVLDFGAGLGTFVALLPTGTEVVALEPDPEFAVALRERFAERSDVHVVESDAAELAADVSLGLFDTIICFNVLEHIADDVGTLRTLHDRLVPGGHLLVLVPAHQWLYGAIDRNVGHERRYRRAVLRERLEAAAYRITDVRYVNPLGALGWLVTSRVLRRSDVPAGSLRVYDRLVPLLRPIDGLPLPIGLSVWAVATKPIDPA